MAEWRAVLSGFNVIEANNLADAHAALAKGEFDCILASGEEATGRNAVDLLELSA